jgi:hypothetical protein
MNGVAQCVPISAPGAYNFGAWFLGANAVNSCAAYFYAGANCQGGVVAELDLPGDALSATTWTELTASGFVGESAKSAFVLCYAYGLLVDKMYLSPAPLRF